MLEIKIPGRKDFALEYLLIDLNGTLALDGKLLSGVSEKLHRLTQNLQVQIITADTFGTAGEIAAHFRITRITPDNQAEQKLAIVRELGENSVVAIGNGRNDELMLKEAAIGIGIIGNEGAAAGTIMSADIVTNNINDALSLLLSPRRLQATLRN